jgi:hypothetical protein
MVALPSIFGGDSSCSGATPSAGIHHARHLSAMHDTHRTVAVARRVRPDHRIPDGVGCPQNPITDVNGCTAMTPPGPSRTSHPSYEGRAAHSILQPRRPRANPFNTEYAGWVQPSTRRDIASPRSIGSPGRRGPCVFHTTSLLVPSIVRGGLEPHTRLTRSRAAPEVAHFVFRRFEPHEPYRGLVAL